MGEVLSLKKIQIAVITVIAVMALGFAMSFNAQTAYAEDSGEVEMGKEVATAEGEYIVVSSTEHKVELVKFTAEGEKGWVPACVKVHDSRFDTDASYKVVAVDDKAFAGNTDVTWVRIGKHVASIGKNVFNNCSNLEKLTVVTTKVSAKAVQKSLGNAPVKVIKVNADKVKEYKKVFKGTGIKIKAI